MENLAFIEETEQICEKHGVRMKRIWTGQVYCAECVLERIAEEEKRRVLEAREKIQNARTCDWLNAKSILTDKSLLHARFENFEAKTPEERRVKSAAEEIAKRYLARVSSGNAILTGDAGRGKSHLAMSILAYVNERDKRRCLFVAVDELMRRIKSGFRRDALFDTEERLIQRLTAADLLVLDDLGAETGAIASAEAASDFTVRTLYSILNGRSDRPTIITTNLTSQQISQLYDKKMTSRLLRGAREQIVTFSGIADKRF